MNRVHSLATTLGILITVLVNMLQDPPPAVTDDFHWQADVPPALEGLQQDRLGGSYHFGCPQALMDGEYCEILPNPIYQSGMPSGCAMGRAPGLMYIPCAPDESSTKCVMKMGLRGTQMYIQYTRNDCSDWDLVMLEDIGGVSYWHVCGYHERIEVNQ